MLLNAARLPARVDGEGNLLLLQDQDRARWDQPMIARGMFHFARSAAGDEITPYHLQAGIIVAHCAAKDFASTDWPHILALYDRLAGFDHSPVVALNRAVAVANVHGPKAGLEAFAAIPDRERLDSYYLFYAVLGEFESRMNEPLAAAGYFRKSIQLAHTSSERQFLARKFRACEERIADAIEESRPV
jgi:RNA polymerase sigma-70 factor (ECF subfamily)